MAGIMSSFVFSSLNLIIAIAGVLLTVFTILFAWTDIEIKRREYLILNLTYVFSFLIVIFSQDWLVFFVAWEMVTITTSLMLIWRGKELATQYFIVQFLGSSFLLLIILVAISQGYTEIQAIGDTWLQNLFIFGLGMKSAIFGLHCWLPAIYSQASVIFNAVSSGWVVKLGFITMLKLITEGNNLLLVLGLLMAFYGGIKALMASNYKVLLAYSSISHLGYIAIGIGSGTIYGYLGSILHIIAHGLAKSGLFLGSANLIKGYGSSSIYEFKDMWSRYKMTSLGILISFASLMGFPVLAGFNSKYLIKYGFENRLFFSIILYAASLLTALYSVRFLYWGIFRDLISREKRDSKLSSEQIGKSEYLVLTMIIVLLISLGFYSRTIINMFEKIEFQYNFLKGFLEISAFTVASILILKGISWNKIPHGTGPTLDKLFNNINRILFKNGQFIYNLVYQDFQYQLLWIPIFLVILFLWILLM
ncbi:complex I subunit 5 family protein [Halocella sp. SP3-1]|uniref:complex I subunit 5 family protein n=1 Tax=Halocella sp. SP3-1 TaxID=2382161 RepID=UPI000F75988D|nr:complex I subunit 5 family protein [Halocella sp. SP3-1]AZO96036.1 NADH-ubiquinone oxidoreductase [Halocella sp. SP3-1]